MDQVLWLDVALHYTEFQAIPLKFQRRNVRRFPPRMDASGFALIWEDSQTPAADNAGVRRAVRPVCTDDKICPADVERNVGRHDVTYTTDSGVLRASSPGTAAP